MTTAEAVATLRAGLQTPIVRQLSSAIAAAYIDDATMSVTISQLTIRPVANTRRSALERWMTSVPQGIPARSPLALSMQDTRQVEIIAVDLIDGREAA